MCVFLSTLLYEGESRMCKKTCQSKLNAMGMGYLMNVRGKRRDRLKNEWMMNEHTKMSQITS